MKRTIFTFALIASAALAAAAQSSGGTYTIDHSVIGNGGGASSNGGSYQVEGTSGQSTAGTSMSGGTYTAKIGFWAPNIVAPTAAGVSVGGRVIGPDGMPLRGVTVSLAGGSLTTPRSARTNSFGYFAFEDVEVGAVYSVGVKSRRYGFPQAEQVFSLVDNLTDIVFQAGWAN